MKVLSLFSGIGAHDLGLEWAGMTIVGQVEIDDYCRSILERHWPDVPKWTDVKTVPVDDLRELRPDIITGGFPCQDISTAGRQAGLDGERSGLWWEMRRIIGELRPRWVLIENVDSLRTKGADRVLAALEEFGYSCWPLVVGAIHVGAPHERQRVWIMGNHSIQPGSEARLRLRAQAQLSDTGSSGGGVEVVADADGERLRLQPGWRCGASGTPAQFAFPLGQGIRQLAWERARVSESPVGSAVHGTPRRLAIRALGNANPPQVVAMIGRAIMAADLITDETV